MITATGRVYLYNAHNTNVLGFHEADELGKGKQVLLFTIGLSYFDHTPMTPEKLQTPGSNFHDEYSSI